MSAEQSDFDELSDPEDDGVLDAEDTLLTDDLSADPLDTGISVPEYRPSASRFGVTEYEALEGESLDQRLAQEEPEIPEVAPMDGQDPRSGRLVAADEGAHDVDEDEPRLFVRDVGIDGGAASAEEAAVHEIGEEDDFDLDYEFEEDSESEPE